MAWLRTCYTVARWEFFRYFKWKDQIIGLVSLLIGAAIGFGAVYLARYSSKVELAVLGGTESFVFPEKSKFALAEGNHDESTWKEMVQAGEIDGLLIISKIAGEPFQSELIVRKEPAWLEELRPVVESEKMQWEIQQANISPTSVERLLTPSKIEITSLSSSDASKVDRLVAYGMLIAMILTSWIGLAYMMTGITGEKQLRVTEQIVSAIRPQMWIDGKLIGITAAAIGSLAFLFASSMICIPVARMIGFEIALPDSVKRWDLIPLMLVFYIGGVLFWNCFYAAVSAIINDPNTSSKTSLLFLPMLPMMAAGLVASQPDGAMMRTLSMVPGTSSTAMPMRLILGEVSLLESVMSVVLLAIGVFALRGMAGRIFAAGIMLYGKEPGWIDILKWAVTRRVDANGLPTLSLLFIALGIVPMIQAVGFSQQESAAQSQSVSFDRQSQLDSFDTVWQTIKDVHWDENRVGESWDKLREELRPQVGKAESIEEVRVILEKLLSQLGQSHCGIIPIDSYEIVEEQSRMGGEGYSGLTIRYVEKQLVVTQVRADSPASRAGIEVGWVLSSIARKTEPNEDGESTETVILATDLIERTQKSVENQVTRFETAVGLSATGLVSGSIGETIEIKFVNNQDVEQTVPLVLEKGSGVPTKMGHLPLINVEFQSSLLPDDIGYISFNAFFDPTRLMKEFQQAVNEDYAKSKGLIIDMRGNMGGMVLLTMGMSGWFAEERVKLGVMQMKNSPLNLVVNPRKPRYAGSVAVLIDDCSISAAEIYAGGLKDIGAARVFGQRSAGLVLPSNVTKLPNNDGFQYVTADYSSASGQVLEGHGVEPDEPIELTRKSLQIETDPVLAAAKRWILSRAK
ncbi:MAG: S41 family peptidase [Pirellula sp.]|nr:S41 family peptidase [Pirellula sp.]